jgi:ATP-binding cassette subfamily F protein 3
MLVCHGISKRYGHVVVLEKVSFSVNPGERVGLIGPNGCGKTTLLRIITGLEEPDEGTVSLQPNSLRVGYLPQGLQVEEGTTLGDVISLNAEALEKAQADLARLGDALAKTEPDPVESLADAYDQALARMQAASSLNDQGRVESTLAALGLGDIEPTTAVSTLSGGQKTRLGLARVLLERPQLLLLDEPTNHLDIDMLEWLESWLAAFDGAILSVSHDRTFLDRMASQILELDANSHSVRAFAGNYSDYQAQIQDERQKHWAAYRDQVADVRRMRQDIARIKRQAERTERGTIDSSQRRYAKKVARKATSREKKLQRFLESENRIEKPAQGWHMALRFQEPEHIGADVLVAQGLGVGYSGEHLLLDGLNLHLRAGERVVLTGPNGAGKTTLLKTIAGELKPQTGTVRLGTSLALGYMSQEQELLNPESTILQIIRHAAPLSETDARTFLHLFLFSGDEPLRPARDLSYGERARLILALLVAQGSNFLLLDEPINHLDIPSRDRFERALHEFEGAVLAVVHDRYFIRQFATSVWVIEGQGIREQIM